MTGKIFRSVFFTSMLTLLLSLILIAGILFSIFDNQLLKELKSETETISYIVETNGKDAIYGLKSNDRRITLIAPDGTVTADTQLDPAEMENHISRKEVSDAVKYGSGTSSRYSDTLMQKTVYYAKKLDDGTILRVSAKQYTAVLILLSLLQPTVAVITGAVLLCLFLSSKISKSIIKPINELDLNNPENNVTYSELTPLLKKIAVQSDTIHKQLDEAYKRRNEFNLITENMSEGFLIVDKNALLLSCNNSALKLLHSEKNCVGETVFTLNRTKQFRDYINTALDRNRSSSTMSLDGLTYEFIATPVFENNRIAGAVIIIIDITESTEREKMRREFTANVSHELKTPLTSISGFAELMKDGNLPKEDVIDFSQSIYDESQRLISLVGDIIKISELDEKSPCFTVEDVDLLDICGNVEKRLHRLADEKDVSVSVSGDDVHIDASPKIIDEMVYNLCENAIKYNKPHGSVSVTVENKNGAAQLSVKDTGIGIPKQDQSHVFERFYRVDKGRSKAVGGTGLGLAIVKHGAMFHGAKISLESTLDVGTEITVTFSAK